MSAETTPPPPHVGWLPAAVDPAGNAPTHSPDRHCPFCEIGCCVLAADSWQAPRESYPHLFLGCAPARLLLRGDKRQGQLRSLFTDAVGGLQLNGKVARPIEHDRE